MLRAIGMLGFVSPVRSRSLKSKGLGLQPSMSYIHEALKKAQKEKDLLVSRHGNVWSTYRYGRRVFRPAWLVSACIVLMAAGFLSYSWLHSSNRSSLHNEKGTAVRRAVPEPPDHLDVDKAHESPVDPGPAEPQASVDRGKKTDQVLPTPSKEAKEQERKAPQIVAKKTEPDREIVPRASEPDSATRLYSQALALQKKGRLQEGKKLYEAVLEQSPRFVSALNNLGAIYVKEGNYAEAARMLEKAIRIEPSYVDPYYNLACLHALRKDVGRSLFYLKKAVSVNQGVREWAKTDTDLENLHGHSEYEKLIGHTPAP